MKFSGSPKTRLLWGLVLKDPRCFKTDVELFEYFPRRLPYMVKFHHLPCTEWSLLHNDVTRPHSIPVGLIIHYNIIIIHNNMKNTLFTVKYDQREELYPKVYRATFKQLVQRLLVSLTPFSVQVEFLPQVILFFCFGLFLFLGWNRPMLLLPVLEHHSSIGPPPTGYTAGWLHHDFPCYRDDRHTAGKSLTNHHCPSGGSWPG